MKSKRTARRSASGRLSLGTYMACAATVGVYGLASSAEASIVVLNLANVGTNSKNITGPNGNATPGTFFQVDNFPSVVGTPNMDVYNMFVDSYTLETYSGVDGDSDLTFAVTSNSKASPRAFSAGDTIDGVSGILWSGSASETVFYFNNGTAFSAPNFGANKYLAFRVDAGEQYDEAVPAAECCLRDQLQHGDRCRQHGRYGSGTEQRCRGRHADGRYGPASVAEESP